MPQESLTRVVLELASTAPPLTGILRVDGEDRAFCGWTGLLSALSAVFDDVERLHSDLPSATP